MKKNKTLRDITLATENKFLISLMEDYEKGKLFNFSRCVLFPSPFRNTLFSYLVYIKIYSKEIFKERIPKLVVFYILEEIVN